MFRECVSKPNRGLYQMPPAVRTLAGKTVFCQNHRREVRIMGYGVRLPWNLDKRILVGECSIPGGVLPVASSFPSDRQLQAQSVAQSLAALPPEERQRRLQEFDAEPELRQLVEQFLQKSETVSEPSRLATESALDVTFHTQLPDLDQTQPTGQPATPGEPATPPPLIAEDIEAALSELARCGLVPASELRSILQESNPPHLEAWIQELIRRRKLTHYQWQEVQAGRGARLLLGNYLILEKLGQGGMGMVLKAVHRRMHRTVALKVLAPNVADSPDAVQRFQREVEAAARLTHPNIVTAFDADTAQGTVFLVMEYVSGRDLSSLVKSRGPFPVSQTLSLILQAARGLQYAHEHGVIHRDIKPANLLLSDDGVVRILDMGLARVDDPTGVGDAQLTATGAVMGTIDYMSPEQALDTRHADARADIYSLGCTLYYLLTGQAVYPESTMMKRLLAHREAAIPSLSAVISANQSAVAPGVLAGLETLFRKMVAKRPEDRYQTIQEVVEIVEALGRGVVPAKAVPARIPVVSQANAQTAVLPGTVQVDLPTIVAEPTERMSAGRHPVKSPRRAGLFVMAGCTAALLLVSGFVLWNAGKASRSNPAAASLQSAGTATTPAFAAIVPEANGWVRGPHETVWPGIVPQPMTLPGIRRWQVDTISSRSYTHDLRWNHAADRLAVAGGDGRIRIYRWENSTLTLDQIIVLESLEDVPKQLKWSPDGRWLAWKNDNDHEVSLWDLQQRQWGPVLPAGLPAGLAGWNREGTLFAAGGHDAGGAGIFLWELPSGKLVSAFRGHADVPHLVAWSADSQYLASASRSAELRVWDVAGTPVLKREYQATSLAWNPRDSLLAIKGSPGLNSSTFDTRLLDLEGTELWRQPAVGPHQVLEWSADGEYLAIEHATDAGIFEIRARDNTVSYTSQGGGVTRVTARPGHSQFAIYAELMPIVDAVTGDRVSISSNLHPQAADWSHQGKWLALADARGSVVIWDAEQELNVGLIPGCQFRHVRVCWSPDGQLLGDTMVADLGSTPAGAWLTTWTREGKQLKRHFATQRGNILDDGWSDEGRKRLVLIEGELLQFRGKTAESEKLSLRLPEGESILFVAGHPTTDQLLLISGIPTVSARVWLTRSQSGTALVPLGQPQLFLLFDGAWNRAGTRFLVRGLNRISGGLGIEVWEPTIPSRIVEFVPDSYWGGHPVFSPDGKMVASSNGGHLFFHKPDTTESLHDWTTSCTWGNVDLAWSPDGARVVVTSDPQGVTLEKYPPVGNSDLLRVPYPLAVDWSRDGRLIASGSLQSSVRVWDLQQKQQPVWTGIPLGDQDWATLGAAGNLLHASPGASEFLFVIFERDDGRQEMRPYAEFVDEFVPAAGLTPAAQ